MIIEIQKSIFVQNMLTIWFITSCIVTAFCLVELIGMKEFHNKKENLFFIMAILISWGILCGIIRFFDVSFLVIG